MSLSISSIIRSLTVSRIYVYIDYVYGFSVLCLYLKSVASKLHGVEVEIKVIKRKGDPLYDNESLANVETSTPANESLATASACPQHHQQQPAEQQILDGASEKCKENREMITNC